MTTWKIQYNVGPCTCIFTAQRGQELKRKELNEYSNAQWFALSSNNPSAYFCGSRKLLRDGQIFILRGDKTYTITGQEVK